MTFEEIFEKAKEAFGSADVSSYEGHLALQINITGEGEGAFYAEIKDGALNIEPYTYNDNHAVLTANADDVVSIFSGTLNTAEAYENGRLFVDGDLAKAFSIQPMIDINKKPAKKSTKKTTAKSTASKTTKTTKTTAKKSTKKAAEEEEVPALVGLAEPKKPAAKSSSKKTTKAAKESTKPAKTTAKTTAKKG